MNASKGDPEAMPEDECARLARKDAERYRWLRERVYQGISRRNECLWSIRGLYGEDGESFDAAIDAALRAERKHE